MIFEGLNLNNPVSESLERALASGRLPHALLLEGSGEETRSALALRIASALVCLNENEAPCFSCVACKKAEKGIHPDIVQTGGGDGAKSFHVDQIRELRADVFVIPNEANKKIYILENAHNMTAQAQNALLKILEEPPEYACFILLCQNKNLMLQTILSRCSLYSLEGSGLQPNEEQQSAISEACSAFALAIIAPSEFEILKAASVFEKDKRLLALFLPAFRETLGAALQIKAGLNPAEEKPGAQRLAGSLTTQRLLDLAGETAKIKKSIDRNANHNLTITRLCTSLREKAGM